MTDAKKPTPRDVELLRLILRSPDVGDGWRNVSGVLWEHVVKNAVIDLVEFDYENKRVRFSPEGVIVMRYLP
jgi:hypothetical protein